MYEDCQELLQLFGLPYIIAPSEAEAQASSWLSRVFLVASQGLWCNLVNFGLDLHRALSIHGKLSSFMKTHEHYKPPEAQNLHVQCAWLDAEGLVDGVVTDDNDVFLFGGRHVYR